ncbi:hypothetical protein P9850_01830 [Anoxybacillus rupiensis]|uniref:Uncharacterized protein n=1 Tax=Anoxybacteroides rupiense TaxID=311460 RepID=A0ABD5IQT0_9BACL|nr:hypothetical protein [Anoxybacillus rupiensis]
MLDSVQREKQIEQSAVHGIERSYLKAERLYTYIALEGFDFLWSLKEVHEFDYLWDEGYSIEYMADYFNRKPIEVLLLALDRAEKGKIKQRKNSIWGEVKVNGCGNGSSQKHRRGMAYDRRGG